MDCWGQSCDPSSLGSYAGRGGRLRGFEDDDEGENSPKENSRIEPLNRLAHGARLCAGQRGTSRSSRERCDALRLVFDTAALRSRF
ncbi:MAG TPA: hypothetical protein VMF08_10750, partial [Candidatus Sulfotelmatobacter sp.]|nr:hypothetical protein [Candidatus Sulfotelmatobacter sp.]